jgi:predicted RNA binding protein YcfA (HicA-like mRNA interferase family)
MPKLPFVKGSAVVSAFKKAGFVSVRTSASHHILKKDGHPNNLSVPIHASKDLKPGTLRGLIKASGLTVEKFKELLN